jgi:hypothetical protein
MARMVVLRDRSQNRFRVLFSTPHALTDGTAMWRAFEEIFTRYAGGSAAVGSFAPLPMVLPAHAPMPGPWWRSAAAFFALVREQTRKHRVVCTPIPESGAPEQRWRRLTLTEAQTRHLIHACKSRDIGVTGAVSAAAMLGLRDALGTARAVFSYRTPMSLRGILPGPTGGPVGLHPQGCFLAAMESVQKVGARTSFDALARECRDRLKAFISRGSPSLMHNLINRIHVRGLRRTPRRGTLAINNLGIVDVSRAYGPLQWEDFYIVPKGRLLGPYLGVMSYTLHDRMSVVAATTRAREEVWERFVDGVFGRVTALAEGRGP